MPVKPTATFTFATNVNYSVGPYTGSPTKVIPGDLLNGFVPGLGIGSAAHNYLYGVTGEWISGWLDLGTSAADLDAHILETNSVGKVFVAIVQLGGTAAADTALRVTSNSGAPSTALLAENIHGGFGIIASNNHSSATLRGVQSGSGYAVQGINLGTGGGGTFDAGTGVAIGVLSEGGSTGGDAFSGTANGTGRGGWFNALGTGSGMAAQRIPTGGPAGEFLQDGAAVPVRGIVHLEPTQTPSAAVGGDLYVQPGVTSFGRGGFYHYDADGGSGGGSAGFQKHWTTAGGIGMAYGDSEGDTTEGAAVLTTKLTLTLDSSGSPGMGQGDYIVIWTASIRLGPGAALSTRAKVEFHDDSGIIGEFDLDFTALGDDKPVTAMKKVTLGVGLVPLEIKFRSLSAGNDVIISRARISAQGAYE